MNDKTYRNLKIAVHCIIILTLVIYFRKWIDPKLVDFKQQPLFLFDRYFLHDHLVYPGGFGEYISLFFSQFFYYPFAGSFIITILLCLVVLATNRILKAFFSGDYVFILQFLPLLLLVHSHSRYNHTLKPDIIIITALYAAVLYKYLIWVPYYLKILLFIIISALLTLFFGGNSLILFAIIAILLDIKNKCPKYIVVIVCYFVITAFIPLLIGRYNPYMNIKKVFLDIFIAERHYTPITSLYILFLFYPVILVLSIILPERYRNNFTIKNSGTGTVISMRIIQLSLPVILLLVALKLSFDRTEKAKIEINYFAEGKDWKSVIKIGEKLPPEERMVIFQLNRALYHTSNLTGNLFKYRQYWGEEGLLLTKHFDRNLLMPISDIYFELGFIRESLHWAYEAQTELGFTPATLKRISLTNIILGEYKIAEKFLKILAKSVIHKKWADRYLVYTKNHDLADSDPLIREKRAFTPKHDFFASNTDPIMDLQHLVNENPLNKMAFEYLIACALLKHDIGKVIQNLHYMPDLKYDKIPRHIEEAILTFMVMQNTTKVNLYGYTIDKETARKFIEYNNLLLKKYNRNMMAARTELYRNFGNTFWFYVHYVSPITTKREFKERGKK